MYWRLDVGIRPDRPQHCGSEPGDRLASDAAAQPDIEKKKKARAA